jgi:hypothetical protein
MFLIEFKKGKFIDAERIDEISTKYHEVIFSLHGKTGNPYVVDVDVEVEFLNQLQALNKSSINPKVEKQ